jgi:hypothetical protein
MDEGDGHGETALQVTQVTEQRCHIGRNVFVDTMEAYERIQQEQPWSQLGDGVASIMRPRIMIRPESGPATDRAGSGGVARGSGAAIA